MDTKTINWGIIGAGKIASKFAEDLNNSSYTKFYGIASRHLTKAKEFGLKHGAAIAYGTYEELLLDKKIDAIYIATPHSFHKEHALLCLKHFKPVLCEKPFAMNLEEVNEMIHLAKANNTLLMEALWTAFFPHFKYVQELIKNKHFGKVLKLEADFGFQPKYDKTSRLFDKSIGGGSLLDIGIYPVFAALSTLGLPNSIKAEAKFFPTGADSECNIVFQYKGSKAFLKSTLLTETDTTATFYCETGTIKINSRFHEADSVDLTDSSNNRETKTFERKTLGYSYEIEHFNQLLRKGQTESNIMSYKRSRELITTLDKIREQIGLVY